MSVVRPQVSVFQQFRAVPSELTNPLRAFIFGPEYDLHRYTEADEKELAGAYDYLLGNTFEWLADLGRRAGAKIDTSYTRVYLEDALLRYWSTTAGPQSSSDNSSYSDPDSIVARTPSGVRHKIRFYGGVNLVDKSGFALDADFYDRDVKVGDYAKVYANIDGDLVEGGGTITAIEAAPTSASIGNPAAVTGNAATQGSSGPTIDDSGIAGDVTVSNSGSAFDGLSVGVLSETYTVTVVRGTTSQDPSTAILNVTSASGLDDVPGYVPDADAFGEAFDIGTLGVAISLSGAGDLAIGDEFTIEVEQAYTAPASVTSSGTYVGEEDATYVVTVTRGGSTDAGTDAGKPLVTVTTNNGYDSYPAQLVDDATNQISLGNYGLAIKFGSNSAAIDLVKGDQWTVSATAAGEGGMRIIVLDQVLPEELVSTDTVVIDLNVELCIKTNIELHRRVNDGGITVNWEQDADEITVNDAAREFLDEWRDGEHSLPVIGGDIYFTWRELLIDHSSDVYSIATLGELTDEFDTPIDPDNPLVYGISKALANSGSEVTPSSGIRAMAVASDDEDGYTDVLSIAENRTDVYALVPMTHDPAVHDLVTTHVTTMSTPDIGSWRICILSVEEVNPAPVVVENDSGTALLATIDEDGLLLATDVDFVAAGVRAGDVVRAVYSSDKYIEETYETFVVDQVNAQTSLALVTAPDPDVATPSKIEVWRSLRAADYVNEVGDGVESLNGGAASRRVYVVYPSLIQADGEEVPGYFLAAAIGGLIGGSAPQQGLTNVQINGFDNANNVSKRFSRSQLDGLANKGVMVVTADLQTGALFIRHQLSTDLTDINTRELSVVKNVDSISFLMRNRLRRFIGRANVTPSAIEVIRTDIEGAISFLKTAGFDPLIGGQVREGTRIRELRPHETQLDKLVIVLDLQIPYPMNYIELTLVI